MISLLCAVAVCVVVHLASAALLAAMLGIKVREASFGFGPVLARFGVVTLRLIPLGGFAKFKDSREEFIAPSDMHDAFDVQPLATRLAIGATGCLALLLIAMATLQLEGLSAFAGGFGQIVSGALSPLGEAQRLLAKIGTSTPTLPFTALLGFAAAKFAAFNLMPFPANNGGFMIANLFRNTPLQRRWSSALTSLLTLAQLALALSWIGAMLIYFIQPGPIDLDMLTGK